MTSKPKMVITGGCGFLGSHLAERFLSRYRIVLIDNLSRNALTFAPGVKTSPDVEIRAGDVRDGALLADSLSGADVVLHLAAIAGVSSYSRTPLDVLRVNLLGTIAVLDAIAAARVPRLVFFSTSEVYGPDAEHASELTSPLVSGPVSERRWTYAVSKLAGEHFVLRHGEAAGFAATCVRPFNVYGPRQVGEGAISNFARCLVRGEPLPVEGDGTDMRSWCFVDDLVNAVELVLRTPDSAGKVFNIGSPDACSTTQALAERMIRIAGRGTIVRRETPSTPIRRRSPDVSLAAEYLGYRSRIGLDEGLARTLAWFEEAVP